MATNSSPIARSFGADTVVKRCVISVKDSSPRHLAISFKRSLSSSGPYVAILAKTDRTRSSWFPTNQPRQAHVLRILRSTSDSRQNLSESSSRSGDMLQHLEWPRIVGHTSGTSVHVPADKSVPHPRRTNSKGLCPFPKADLATTAQGPGVPAPHRIWQAAEHLGSPKLKIPSRDEVQSHLVASAS